MIFYLAGGVEVAPLPLRLDSGIAGRPNEADAVFFEDNHAILWHHSTFNLPTTSFRWSPLDRSLGLTKYSLHSDLCKHGPD